MWSVQLRHQGFEAYLRKLGTFTCTEFPLQGGGAWLQEPAESRRGWSLVYMCVVGEAESGAACLARAAAFEHCCSKLNCFISKLHFAIYMYMYVKGNDNTYMYCWTHWHQVVVFQSSTLRTSCPPQCGLFIQIPLFLLQKNLWAPSWHFVPPTRAFSLFRSICAAFIIESDSHTLNSIRLFRRTER